MTRVRAFFLEEAAECLAELRRAVRAADADLARFHGAARKLRGTAQVARYGPVAAAAGRLERRLKRVLDGQARWTETVSSEAARDLAAVEAVVQAVEAGRIRRDERLEDRVEPNEDATADEVPIDDLEYRGSAALHRAMDLRASLEDAIVGADPIGPILDELFDLIRLGMSDRE